MVLPTGVFLAARRGDAETVIAWLDATDVVERRDVNDVDDVCYITLLMAVARDVGCDKVGSVAHLNLARELIRRGADVNIVAQVASRSTAFEEAIWGGSLTSGELVRDFVQLLIAEGLALKRSRDDWDPLRRAIEMFKHRPTRAYAEVIFALLRAGAPLDSLYKNGFESAEFLLQCYEPPRIRTGDWLRPYRPNEHWVACTKLVDGIRAAGGTWTAYRKQSRKDVLRLRSLVLRGRAKKPPARCLFAQVFARAADPVVARVFQLPNELCWHVLKFWRATSDATGEVI